MSKRIRQAMDAAEKIKQYGSLEKQLKTMSKADELWEKRIFKGYWLMTYSDFLSALQEYGESVRQQAVRVCNRPKPECCGRFVDDDHSTSPICCGNLEPGDYMDGPDCAAAIEKMEIK